MSVCDLETIRVPSMFNVIHSTVSLPRMLPTLDLSCGTGHGQITQAELLKLQKSGQFPDESVRIKIVNTILSNFVRGSFI